MRTVMLIITAVVLAGCQSAPAPAAPGKSEEISRAAVGFSQCMRDRGHQVPDPTFNDEGLPVFQEPSGEGYQADRQECRKPLNDALIAAGVPNQKGSPEQWLAFARCMRENGVDMPDPTPENRFVINKAVYDSPAWEPAAQACGSLLPPGMRSLLQPPGPKGGNGK
ncbi:hypothetical protein LWC34_00955 [Kibdelosporangium philippinense]|uniref:Lipoprotein n=1 Tax=Kibdelosporangium philippinense TaxID=211113 RepID=A0ABS8Z0B1_9PSEU|nr:hypothetical protein [Kibdelosporangium philippinense]MCE7001416.1 hypothetical protein [Kibdelosporangium philippinense]